MPPISSFFVTAGMVGVIATALQTTRGTVLLMWQPVGILFMALVVLLTADLLTEFFAMPPSERRVFLWEREITGKLLLVSLVVISLVLDLVVYQVAKHMPRQVPMLDNGHLFVTLTTLLWLIGASVTHITRNVATAEGEDAVPPTLNMLARQIRWLLRTMRFIDDKRVAQKPDTPPDAVVERPSRWYDTITDEEVQELAQFLQDRQQQKPSLPPMGVVAKQTKTERGEVQ